MQATSSRRRSSGSGTVIVAPWTLGLALGVVGAVFLKRASAVSSAEGTVAGWILCGLLCLLVCGSFQFFRRDERGTHWGALRAHWKWLTVHAAVFLSMGREQNMARLAATRRQRSGFQTTEEKEEDE